MKRLIDLSSKFAAQVTFTVFDAPPSVSDELDRYVLSIWAEAKRQTYSATIEVYCVCYLREETVVFSLPKPKIENPVVVRVSLMDEVPNEDT